MNFAINQTICFCSLLFEVREHSKNRVFVKSILFETGLADSCILTLQAILVLFFLGIKTLQLKKILEWY